MYSIEILILVSLVMIVIGIAIGVVAGRAWVPPQQQKALESSLHSAKQELEAYQQDVAKHFQQTSRHVTELTQSYRDLHEHLAKGALHLTNTDISRQMLDAGEKQAKLEGFDQSKVQPPRDWAPRRTTGIGTLSEEYGLKDTEHTDDSSSDDEPHPSPTKPS